MKHELTLRRLLGGTKCSSVVNDDLVPIVLDILPIHQLDLREILSSLKSVSNGSGDVQVRRVGEEGEKLIVCEVGSGVVAGGRRREQGGEEGVDIRERRNRLGKERKGRKSGETGLTDSGRSN